MLFSQPERTERERKETKNFNQFTVENLFRLRFRLDKLNRIRRCLIIVTTLIGLHKQCYTQSILTIRRTPPE